METYKPADFFIGVVDFFAILLPGGLLAFVAADLAHGYLQRAWPQLDGAGQSWIAFLFVSYLLGHLTFALSAQVLDTPIYDRYYKPYRRRHVYAEDQRNGTVLPGLSAGPSTYDPLCALARDLMTPALAGTSSATSDPLRWATTVVRLQNPPAASEIDRLEADSKFFRGLTLVLPVIAVYCALYKGSLLLGLVCLAVAGLCLWRYLERRWKRVQQTYEYYIALARFQPATIVTAAPVTAQPSALPASAGTTTAVPSSACPAARGAGNDGATSGVGHTS